MGKRRRRTGNPLRGVNEELTTEQTQQRGRKGERLLKLEEGERWPDIWPSGCDLVHCLTMDTPEQRPCVSAHSKTHTLKKTCTKIKIKKNKTIIIKMRLQLYKMTVSMTVILKTAAYQSTCAKTGSRAHWMKTPFRATLNLNNVSGVCAGATSWPFHPSVEATNHNFSFHLTDVTLTHWPKSSQRWRVLLLTFESLSFLLCYFMYWPFMYSMDSLV